MATRGHAGSGKSHGFAVGQRVCIGSKIGVVSAVWPRLGMLDVCHKGTVSHVAMEAATPFPSGEPRSVRRVASAFVKKALYWHARDRKYRMSRGEHQSGTYNCPSRGCDGVMRKGTYMMEDGQRARLFVCPECIFMIRVEDILSDHCVPAEEVEAC